MNKEQSFNLVKTILRSPIFHSQSLEQRINILNQILVTGEVTREELSHLINEVQQQIQDENKNPLLNDPRFIERLDYNGFLNLVIRSDIKGKDLISLCNTSRKLNGYCNKALILPNGQIIDQYLFILLLNKMRVKLFPGQIPREVYKRKTIGGRVYSFGANYTMQLGLGDQSNRYISTLIPNLNGIIAISTGRNHSLVLDNKGRIWGFGDNSNGQLGLGNYQDQSIPSLIPNFNNIIAISAGGRHSLILDNRGQVWSFGRGGPLGLGDHQKRPIPTLIPNLNGIVTISAGGLQSLILDNKGRVWSFGDNWYGELGLGDHGDKLIPTLIPNLENIVEISAGRRHSLVLDNQGRVWSFGDNEYGQLGLGHDAKELILIPTLIPNLENIVAISAGEFQSLVLDNQGRVWGFGNNYHGQLGFGDEGEKLIPTLIPNLENIVEISAGAAYSLVLDNQGRVWSFGYNEYGYLGLGDDEERTTPTLIPDLDDVIAVSAGEYHSLILK